MSYFHPKRMPALPARRRVAARRQLEELVARSARSARSGRRPPPLQHVRQPAALATIMSLVVLGTGAAAFVMLSPVTNHSSMRCYSAPRRSDAYYMTVTRTGQALTSAEVQHVRRLCSALFREGFLRSGKKVAPPKRPLVRHRVPTLVVCVDADGTAAVVPGREALAAEVCEQLGLKAAARQ